MKTIREILSVKDKKVIIELPDDFTDNEVEVFVMPARRRLNDDAFSLKELLLNGPIFKQEQIKNIENVKRWFNKWNIVQY